MEASMVPTIINAKGNTTRMEYVIRVGLHIGLWLLAITFQCIMGFNVANYLDDCVLHTNTTNNTEITIHGDPSQTTINLGITGASFTVIGVALVLGVGAFIDMKPELKDGFGQMLKPYIIFAIHFSTIFGTLCAFYIFSQAAQDPENCDGYTSGLFGVSFLLLAQFVLYSNINLLERKSDPSSLLVAATLSVQIISYAAIQSNDFAKNATDTQKLVSMLSPLATFVAALLFLLMRSAPMYQSVSNQVVGALRERSDPFVRSLVLFVFTITGMLSIYKLSFVAAYPDSTSYLFALADSILTVITLCVMFLYSNDRDLLTENAV